MKWYPTIPLHSHALSLVRAKSDGRDGEYGDIWRYIGDHSSSLLHLSIAVDFGRAPQGGR